MSQVRNRDRDLGQVMATDVGRSGHWHPDENQAGPIRAARPDRLQLLSCKTPGHEKRLERADGYCRDCVSARKRKSRTQGRVAGLWRSFQLTEADYLALRESQRSAGRVRCYGCHRPVDAGKEPAVDHSHQLERAGVPIRYTVRMLLCQPCNVYLGYIGDNPVALIRLALGLIEMPAQKVLKKLDER